MIDYAKLARAKRFYSHLNYQYINVPWIVPQEYIDITRPEGKELYKFQNQFLLASAENSFIYLADTQGLKGQFQAITPCFREEIEDEIHKQYFMKLELIRINENNNEDYLFSMIDNALSFFRFYLDCEIFDLKDGTYDIIDSTNKIELGSYGIRKYKDIEWVYGTGCAEPRLSYVCGL